MYSSVAGGVSNPRVWNAADSPGAALLIVLAAAARQLESSNPTTAVCEVVVREQPTDVVVPLTASGVCGSRFTASTTKTSRSKGERFKSIEDWLKVLAAVSSDLNPMETTLEDCFRPVGIYWGVPR